MREQAKVWHELRHPVTRKLVAKICYQSEELEVVDRGKRGIIKLKPITTRQTDGAPRAPAR